MVTDAMEKPHKHAGDRISITSRLSPAEVTDCAVSAIEGIKSTSIGINGVTTGQKISIAASGPTLTNFTIKNAFGATLMHFSLSVDETGGTTRAESAILKYTTTQGTIMFVPVGPRTMDGFHMYEAWSQRLARLVAAQDSTAEVTSSMAR